MEDLVWLGLPALRFILLLAPYVTLLPTATPVNINTASAEVLYASTVADLADAQRLVSARQKTHFKNVSDVSKALGQQRRPEHRPLQHLHVFFEVRGRLRLDQTTVEERSLLQRDGGLVRTLWRERGTVHGLDEALAAAPPR